jgi:formylmethanofuran--tetrahydromethanopterin N-formyltransferase
MRAEVEDTYAEAFEGLFVRVIITAEDMKTLSGAAESATATPSIVIGRVEGGIEKWLSHEETPDGREGAVLQFWGGIDDDRPLQRSLERFESELSYRIRQDILVRPFTALFDALPHQIGRFDMMEKVGHCGDGFEWEENRHGREMLVVPLMVPDFLIERYLGYAKGVMGANFWYMCTSKEAVMAAGSEAIEAISKVEGVITPFGICAAGSKPETNYPHIGPTTNHPYCPSLKEKLADSSKVPEGIRYIPEIVINGISLKAAKRAMKMGIEAARSIEGVRRISAGNYGGKLGKYRIGLRTL